MEKIIQYFIQELHRADNALVKLSVVTALHESFLTKVSSSKMPACISNLLQCLLKILKDEFSLNDHNEMQVNGSSSSCRIENDETKTRADHRLGDSFSRRKSISPSETAARSLLKRMTLKCIYEFSCNKENLLNLDGKVKKSIVSFLSNICDFEKNRYSPDCDIFRYSPTFTSCVKKYINLMDRRVTVKVFPDVNNALCDVANLRRYLEFYGETETSENIWQIIESCPFELLGLSVFEHLSARDDSENKHVDLLDLLVSQQVAWRRCDQFRPEKDKVNSGVKKTKLSRNDSKIRDGKLKTDVCDSVVRIVMNGNLLWVNVGKDSIVNVEQVHLILKQELKSGNLRRCRCCTQNAIVAVILDRKEMQWCCEAQQEKMIIRGRILSVISGIVTIFGIDVGGVYKVPLSSIFCLPSDLDISTIPQQVTLAYLYDTSPTPVECSHVELSVAIMCNFYRFYEMAKDFVDLNFLCILPALISCGDSTIAYQAVKLSTVISRFAQVDCSNDWCQILFSLLECLNKLVQKYIKPKELKQQRATLQSTVFNKEDTIHAITQHSAEAVDDNGNSSESPSKKIQSDLEKECEPKSSPMKSPSSKGAISKRQQILVKEIQEHEPSQNIPTTKPNIKDKRNINDCSLVEAYLKVLANFLHKNQPMKDVFYHQSGLEIVLICLRVFGHKCVISSSAMRLLYNFVNTHSTSTGLPGHKKSQVAIMDEATDGDDGSGDDDNEIGSDADDFDEDDEWTESGSSDTSSSHPDKGEKDSRFLIKGSVYPHVTNPRYEMLEGLDWTSLSLAAIVCGMFNSGQVGTICVGVGKGGEVRGEAISHDMRDELRLGMDDLMAHLVPNVMHFQLQVRFVPVVTSASEFEDSSLIQLYVIEILCNPIRGVIHTLKNGKAYYRTGSKTILVNEQGFRQLIVIDEEQKFMDEMLDLQRKLQILSNTSEGDE